MSPDGLKLAMDDTTSVDIWLFPYATICPVLMMLVVKEETANWGVLIVVAVRLPILAESLAMTVVTIPRFALTGPSNKFGRALFVATIFGVSTAYATT